ncbi:MULTISPECIES: hypothetical protein [unclassified Kitasatospora]|uniref:hypothetical protein n=1 Tax=unclassified Kitasatospora TaxID=2633591 RepID=UPI00070C1604|nr:MULTISPECIES: hypothetical protein [unclassified Kitasatospora]KQV18804.1 hypothetical protein ASC99_06340 [Kitasatospora sp. Root107]KRB74786.1 hypothetical protein ASE03_20275 [Kitasatospora sp. Root187]
MSQKVRFITIVTLGFSVLTGAAVTAQVAGSAPTAVVLTADGAPGDVAMTDNITTGLPTPLPIPAATAVPSPLPTGPQDTWGWG